MGERWYTQQQEGARNMKKGYTNEQVAQMIKLYGEGTNDAERRTIVEDLAKSMGKTVGSIRAKLVSVGHYIKLSGKTTATSTTVVRKESLVTLIENKLEMTCPSLQSMTKVDLETLVARLV